MTSRAQVIRLVQKEVSRRSSARAPAESAVPRFQFIPYCGPVRAANDATYIPEVYTPLERGNARYRVAHGGRGSAKSWYFAHRLVREHMKRPGLRSICVREVQKSMGQSVKKLIETVIDRLGVRQYFDIKSNWITCPGGGRIDFLGLSNATAESIKSYEGAEVCWVEEGQTISKHSLMILRPTIRAPGSEIWFSYNPTNEDDPVDVLFRGEKPPKSCIVVEANWHDNPFLSQDALDEMREDYDRDPQLAEHVWGGTYLKRSDAAIFNRWSVDDFKPADDWEGPYYGLDWGFSNDPTAAVKCWVHAKKLYIEHEASSVGLELDDTPAYLSANVPGIAHSIVRADSARPESIRHVQKHGMPNTTACKKWPGCVEDGVAIMKSFEEVVIHTRCTDTRKEFSLYAYKINQRSGEVLNVIADKWNHCIDAIRYALEPIIRSRTSEPSVRSL